MEMDHSMFIMVTEIIMVKIMITMMILSKKDIPT